MREGLLIVGLVMLAATARAQPRRLANDVALAAGGSAVTCGVELRPFLRESDESVRMLRAPEYEARVARSSVHVEPSTDGYALSMAPQGGLTVAEEDIAYDVVEVATGRVVLVGHVSLSCASSAVAPAVRPYMVVPGPVVHVADTVDESVPAAEALSVPRLTVPITGPTVAPLVRPTQHPELDAARALAVTGYALVVASGLTLLVEGMVSLLPDYVACQDPSCASSTAVHVNGPPEDLSWSALGGIGLGMILGTIGLALAQPSADEHTAFGAHARLDASGLSVSF